MSCFAIILKSRKMNNIEINSVKTGASLLDTLTSALYANPIVTFREYVQNAIDSFSSSETTRDKKIEIFINSELNQIIISDNGNGIPTAEFKEKMCSFGQSSKMGHQDQLGFRGIGRLSGLSFCETLHFINKADPENPQYFSLNGKNYREILSGAEGGSESLTNVLNRIASTEKPRNLDLKNNERGFEVVMTNITDELWDCICSVKIGRGKNKATNTPQNLQKRMPSESFINELSMLLPIPYNNEFKSAEGIYNKYKEALGVDLHIREFKVFLDGKQLFKPFEDAPTSAFQIIPIKIVSTSIQSEEKKYISNAIKTIEKTMSKSSDTALKKVADEYTDEILENYVSVPNEPFSPQKNPKKGFAKDNIDQGTRNILDVIFDIINKMLPQDQAEPICEAIIRRLIKK